MYVKNTAAEGHQKQACGVVSKKTTPDLEQLPKTVHWRQTLDSLCSRQEGKEIREVPQGCRRFYLGGGVAADVHQPSRSELEQLPQE